MTVIYRKHQHDLTYLPNQSGEIIRCRCGLLFISRAQLGWPYYGWWRMGPLSRWWHRKKLP